jgi:peptide/nickel transport system ATP-binding protein
MSSPHVPLVRMQGLCIETGNGYPIVQDVDFSLGRGEVLGIVGESGSGKTTTALSLVGHVSRGILITAGVITTESRRIDATDRHAATALRGPLFSYVPQSPGTALNPIMRVEAALNEAREHSTIHAANGSRAARRDLYASVLESVGLPQSDEFLRRFPHQLSGGQQQRVCIAIALMSGSKVIILDEPTTGLDVITQAAVLRKLDALRQERGVSMIYISHDLAVIAQVASRVAVMYAGRIVEIGDTSAVLRAPLHPYTRGLIASTPDHRNPYALVPMLGTGAGPDRTGQACGFRSRCDRRIEVCDKQMPPLAGTALGDGHSVRCFNPAQGDLLARFPRHATTAAPGGPTLPILAVNGLRVEHHGRGGRFVAVSDVSFTIGRGECLALVGESGSGKSSLARAIAGLQDYQGGSLNFQGETLAVRAKDRPRNHLSQLQIVFQNPSSALNPREDVQAAIERAQRAVRSVGSKPGPGVADLMRMVELPPALLHRYPRELSGGEKQRVCIARALASQPTLMICDEITSALDVSVQAAILVLLQHLQDQLGLSMLFITHDIGVVASIANRIIVLSKGVICETGLVDVVLDTPTSDYARNLISSAPTFGALH